MWGEREGGAASHTRGRNACTDGVDGKGRRQVSHEERMHADVSYSCTSTKVSMGKMGSWNGPSMHVHDNGGLSTKLKKGGCDKNGGETEGDW
mmetsp:Transcript_14134/g.19623  ORF Transcript_14134/g.19623 Transcript_14134/m.19623 type:complete len:92 (-) Transcript_14134:177-452(-)